MSISEAVHTFSILTIGDGLVAQIPALLISTATGILVTRSASTTDLGSEISGEMLREPRAPLIAGGAIAALALVPGLPKLPFLIVGASVYAFGRASKGRIKAEAARKKEEAQREQEAAAGAPSLELSPGALAIDPLELSIGFGLVPLVDERTGGSLLARDRRRAPPDRGRARARDRPGAAPRRHHARLPRVRREGARRRGARARRSCPATAWR